MHYRSFIDWFSSSFTTLTQKKVNFEWPKSCDRRFQKLKTKLTFALVLTLTESTKDFLVYCDAYLVGLGCVLMKHGKVIAYTSRQLKVHDMNFKLIILE